MKRRWLTIDLTAGQVEVRAVGPREALRGGRWRTVRELLDRGAPGVDPLGADNPIVVAVGPFAGSSYSNANRVSVGTKSPLTGTVKEANSGGTLGYALGQLGLAGFTLLGAARDWVVLVLGPDGVRFEDAAPYLGLGSYAAAERLWNDHPKAASLGFVGPVAEYGGLLSGFVIPDADGQPGRLAARGGVGAVFAAKRVKAMVVEKGAAPDFVGDAAFKQAMRAYAKALLASDGVKRYTTVGTAGMGDFQNMMGGLPVRNFSRGRLAEGENPLGGEALRRLILQRDGEGATAHACMPGCVIRCSNKVPDAQGRVVVSPLEYETLGLVGSNLGFDDLDAVAHINRLANDLGVDTIELGATLGVAMDAGLGAWGSLDFVERVVEALRTGSEEGRRYAQGAARLGRALGHGRVPVVRDQGISAYDPRVVEGTGVTYMTTPQGADHTAGNVARLNPGEKSLEELMDLSFAAQVDAAASDALGLCIFGGSVTYAQKDAVMEAATRAAGLDEPLTAADFDRLGREVLAMELEFNRAAGHPEVAPLPRFMYEEPLPPRHLTSRLDPAALAGFWKRLER
ncbi:aldehyde ferredoxin oxidoreductase C-terminal domain-containing protein [Oceanithermus sp.]|uniref:aldehyde ferredoxin oxidoreductase C-terminal domain-containing protein n=1 Tax=Oceanithermus sp. TaxID=2268145 RepID=UPI0025D2F3BD|nr:aldehyde ferredoxin oxidoreductase C-terminal domain-containing protein [Oceanithermus sp.]